MPTHKIVNKKNNELVTIVTTFLTRAISPLTTSFLAVGIIYREYILPEEGSTHIWLLAAAAILFLSIATMLLFMKLKLVSNWDITDRTQRPKLLAVMLLYLFALVGVTWKLGYTGAIPVLSLLVFSMLVASLITLLWKISFHTFCVTLACLFIIFTYDSPYLYALLIVPWITAATRIYLKKHTPLQAISGILLALTIVLMWVLVKQLSV